MQVNPPTNQKGSNIFFTDTKVDDLDMLIIQQNDVMEELLEDSFFSDELKKIRQQFVEECWGKQTSARFKL